MSLFERVPCQQDRYVGFERGGVAWPTGCTGCQPQFDSPDGGSEHIAKSSSMGALNAMRDFQVLRRSPSSREGVNDPTGRDETSGRHAEPLTGRALKGDLHLDVFVRTQERGIITGLDEIQVEVNSLKVVAMHILDRHRGGFWCVLFVSKIWRDPRHGLTGRGLFAVEGSGDFDAMVNGKPCALAALTSSQGGGFVNRKEEGNVATAAMGSGGHPSKRRGIG